MQTYANRGGDSGIRGFTLTPNSITVVFSDGSEYLYDNVRPGQSAVQQMRALAHAGQGLNEYINRYVRGNYAARLR